MVHAPFGAAYGWRRAGGQVEPCFDDGAFRCSVRSVDVPGRFGFDKRDQSDGRHEGAQSVGASVASSRRVREQVALLEQLQRTSMMPQQHLQHQPRSLLREQEQGGDSSRGAVVAGSAAHSATPLPPAVVRFMQLLRAGQIGGQAAVHTTSAVAAASAAPAQAGTASALPQQHLQQHLQQQLQQREPEWCRHHDRRVGGIYRHHPYGLGPCYDCGGPHNARFGRLFGLHTAEYQQRQALCQVLRGVGCAGQASLPLAALQPLMAAKPTAVAVACQTESDSDADEEEEPGMSMVFYRLTQRNDAATSTEESAISGGAQPAAYADEGLSGASESQDVGWHAPNPLYGDEAGEVAESLGSGGAQPECASTSSEQSWEQSMSEAASAEESWASAEELWDSAQEEEWESSAALLGGYCLAVKALTCTGSNGAGDPG